MMQTKLESAIRSFRVDIPQADLDDLHDRLRRTVWPDELPGVGDAYGVTNARVRELTEYWLREFDWRRLEARLNAVPQFKTEIDGEDIHFLHVTSSRADATPMVLTHGWPGTVVEYLNAIRPPDGTIVAGCAGVSRRHPVAAGLWFLGAYADHRVESVPHCQSSCRVDAPSRLRSIHRRRQ